MSAKACSSGQNVLDLWAYTDNTNRQLFQISGYGTGVPIGINVTFVNVGRTTEGCANYLSVAAAAGQCSNNKVQLGSKTSLGATVWEIQNVPGQPGHVYITNAVRRPGGVFEGGGGLLGASTYSKETVLTPPHPTAPLQARRAASCTQYLGASTTCNNIEAGMYSAGDPNAIVKWQLIKV